MLNYNDNDIEVLGEDTQRLPHKNNQQRSLLIVIFSVLALIAIIVIVTFILVNGDVRSDVQDSTTMAVTMSSAHTTELPSVTIDSINDVSFVIIPLDGLRAAITFTKPDSLATDIVLALPAADFRADNGEIVGEFVHDNRLMARGTRKPGFCYLSPDGIITIGSGSGEKYRETALSAGGTFFRQYALVMDGQMQPNTLKGKSLRRAIGFFDGRLVVVMSQRRESIYDFSQALADYGFSHALYLPGGDSFLKLNADDIHLFNDRPALSPYVNYLIFKQ